MYPATLGTSQSNTRLLMQSICFMGFTSKSTAATRQPSNPALSHPQQQWASKAALPAPAAPAGWGAATESSCPRELHPKGQSQGGGTHERGTTRHKRDNVLDMVLVFLCIRQDHRGMQSATENGNALSFGQTHKKNHRA